MKRKDVEDRQIVERYLAGRLAPDEERAFEELYLADPDVLDDLVVTEKLRQGLRTHATRGEADGAAHAVAGQATRDRAGRDRVGHPAPRRRRTFAAFGSPRYAAAASALLALSVVWSGALYLENRDLRERAAQTAGTAMTTRLLPLVTVRGDGVNTVESPAADEWTVFLVDAGFTEYDEYRAVVTRRTTAGREPVRRLDGLTLTYDGMVAVGLPGGLLAPGDYEIQVVGRMRAWPSGRAADAVATTPLRIVPRS